MSSTRVRVRVAEAVTKASPHENATCGAKVNGGLSAIVVCAVGGESAEGTREGHGKDGCYCKNGAEGAVADYDDGDYAVCVGTGEACQHGYHSPSARGGAYSPSLREQRSRTYCDWGLVHCDGKEPSRPLTHSSTSIDSANRPHTHTGV